MSILEDLLAATPVPPHDTDIDTLLAMFAAMLARRSEILGAVQTIPVATDAERALVATLTERQRAWLTTLEAARERVREQRIASTKLRHYASGMG